MAQPQWHQARTQAGKQGTRFALKQTFLLLTAALSHALLCPCCMQFAHGEADIRQPQRHPKYKTKASAELLVLFETLNLSSE